MDIRPLTPALGAEITGVDLGVVNREKFEAILDAWSRHLVLVFPRQRLTDEQLLRSAAISDNSTSNRRSRRREWMATPVRACRK